MIAIHRHPVGDDLGVLLDVAGQEHDVVDARVAEPIDGLLHVLPQGVLDAQHAQEFAVLGDVDDVLARADQAIDGLGRRGQVDGVLLHEAPASHADDPACHLGLDAAGRVHLGVLMGRNLPAVAAHLLDDGRRHGVRAGLLGGAGVLEHLLGGNLRPSWE